MSDSLKVAAEAVEVVLTFIGAVLAWRLVLSPAARARKPTPALPAWDARGTDLLIFLLHTLVGGFIGSAVAGIVSRPLALNVDKEMIVATAGLHLGILAGVTAFSISTRQARMSSKGAIGTMFKSGIVTFLIALPIVFAAGFAWMGLMTLVGLPVEKQPAVELFMRLRSSAWLPIMAVTAALIAPISEELVFRRGLFRFMRTRTSRGAALVLPAALFAASHQDINTAGQLAVLGIVFSLAYERTGIIGTTIVAHALFNLNSILLVLAGVTA